MEAAVVGAAVGATVKVMLQNLISVSTKEIKLIRGYKKDLEKLRNTLITIQGFVYGAETLHVTDISVKQWLKKLEDAAFQAYYVLDEIDYLSLRKDRYKMETKTTFKKKIRSITLCSKFCDRLKLGHKIGDISKEFELINREASSLGLPTRLAGLHATGVALHASGSSETDSFTSDPVFLGRDHDVNKIVEKLNYIQPDQVFSILPIVGMGGMGKSTLAREVVKVQTHFETHIWVHVSAKFDPIIIFKKILMILTSKEVKVENREVILKNLQKPLANKIYLLVLDDVWNEERIKWEDLINSLSGITSTKGNLIIVTTRKSDVASIVATLPIHDLQGLSEKNCWSIIKAKAFSGYMPSEFETLGKNIAKKCQGLPLAANVVGGLLRGKSKHEWASIQEHWLSDHVEGDFIQKILKLSFDNLALPSLKKCFAYWTIYPKGAHVRRITLIELWMAEEFLEADQRNDMETVGNKYLDILLRNSLLQVEGRDEYNNVLRCSMHDLVHDLALKVNDNVSCGHELYGEESKGKVKYARSLVVQGGITDDMFSGIKSLHVLILTGYHVTELPSSIRELWHLRYLNIHNTEIEELPDSIGELYHLLILRTESYRLCKLPSTLKYLIGLRHLHVNDHTKLPGELGKLTSLQSIPYFAVGEEKGHRIEELGRLKNLKGKLKIYNLEKARDEEEAKSACIIQNSDIVELELQWNESVEGETDYKGVLEGLQPHPNLKKLLIDGFKGTQFPSWASKMGVQNGPHWDGLDNLMEIILSSCSKCEEIPMMGHLPHLKSLFLGDMRNVKSIGSSFYGIDHCISSNDTIIVFPALQRLILSDMPKMREWVGVELGNASEIQSGKVQVFPCLEYLEISRCKDLRSAPSHFPCLKEVKIYKMVSSLPLANICGTELTSLTILSVEELEELESLPHGLFYNNQHLIELNIRGCRRLRELEDLHTLNSLRHLSIQICPSLNELPDCSGGNLASLRSLVIEDCGEFMNVPCEMIESCAPSLVRLQLVGLRDVMNVQMIIDCLHKMPRLTVLGLYLPKFFITSSAGAPTFRSLREFRMGPYSDSWDCVSFKEAVDGILMRFGSNSLRELRLSGKEDWDSLPDQLQHLSAIRRLYLSDFGIQELPEWFGNLTSIKGLRLFKCKTLRYLPSMEADRRLTKLCRVKIYDQEGGFDLQSDDEDHALSDDEEHGFE